MIFPEIFTGNRIDFVPFQFRPALKMIRAERRFSSIEALKQQMEQDIAAGEAFANER